MKEIIQFLLLNGYNFRPDISRVKKKQVYVLNYNGVRHWSEIYEDTIHMYSFQEGTGDDIPITDTGIVDNPTLIFVKDWVNKSKELM